MKKRIISICPLSFGASLGSIYFVLSLVWYALFLVCGLNTGDAIKASGLPVALTLGLGAFLFPFACGVIGFLFGAITALVHNGVAKVTGGIRVVLVDAP